MNTADALKPFRVCFSLWWAASNLVRRVQNGKCTRSASKCRLPINNQPVQLLLAITYRNLCYHSSYFERQLGRQVFEHLSAPDKAEQKQFFFLSATRMVCSIGSTKIVKRRNGLFFIWVAHYLEAYLHICLCAIRDGKMLSRLL